MITLMIPANAADHCFNRPRFVISSVLCLFNDPHSILLSRYCSKSCFVQVSSPSSPPRGYSSVGWRRNFSGSSGGQRMQMNWRRRACTSGTPTVHGHFWTVLDSLTAKKVRRERESIFLKGDCVADGYWNVLCLLKIVKKLEIWRVPI